jgi:hypothetical protein
LKILMESRPEKPWAPSDRLGDDFAAPFGRQALAVLFGQPGGDVAGEDLHFQQLQVLGRRSAVYFRVADPFQQGLGAGVEAGGDHDAGEIVQHPGQKAVVDVAAENIAVDGDLGVEVQDVGILMYSMRSRKRLDVWIFFLSSGFIRAMSSELTFSSMSSTL